MIRSLFFALLVFVFAGNAQAEPLIMSAPEAASAVANDALILIDIRSPAEWDETGVAQGAIALTMHDTEFPKKISAILNGAQGKPIGLICATGGRTEYVVSFLAKNGFTDVIDVSEGMMGNARGPGWVARGMPLVTSEDAQNAYRILTLTR